jgi:sporulation protein YlmC with PRC-barrel domain
MLLLRSANLGQPIISLRNGSQIATSQNLIISPNNLKIEALRVSGKLVQDKSILLCSDIREINKIGLLINDYSDLSSPNDLVRLKEVLEINFVLLGKPVYQVSGGRVGKVSDFAFDGSSFYVQKLYLENSLLSLRSPKTGALTIDRSQINEITNRRIIINDLDKTSRVKASAPVPA